MYKVNNRIYKNRYHFYVLFSVILFLCIVLDIAYLIVSKKLEMLIPLFFIVIFFVYALHIKAVVSMKIDSIKYLEKNGKLVKNLPYDIGKYYRHDGGGTGTYYYYGIVSYQFEDGKTEILTTPSDISCMDLINNKYMDLLYDEKDPSNYYLDYNIQEVGDNNE